MRFIKHIIIGLVFSVVVLLSCNNRSQLKNANRLIQQNGILELFEIGSDWDIIKCDTSFDEYLNLTIRENNYDTIREIELIFSLKDDTLPYFNCDSFHYIDEKISYYDQDSNYHEILKFHNDTVYEFKYLNDLGSGYIVNDFERIVFRKGKEYYKVKYDSPSWEERNSFFIRGLWNLNVGDTTFSIRFRSDSVFINNTITDQMILHDKYEILDDSISLSNGRGFDVSIKRILPLTLMVEYNDSTLYAQRIRY